MLFPFRLQERGFCCSVRTNRFMIALFCRIKDCSIIMRSGRGRQPGVDLCHFCCSSPQLEETSPWQQREKSPMAAAVKHVRSRPRSKWQHGGGLPPSLWLRTDIRETGASSLTDHLIQSGLQQQRLVCGHFLHEGGKPKERLGCQEPRCLSDASPTPHV